MTGDELLAEARRMLDEATPGTVAVWPRAAALLARQVLEDALREFWTATAPGVERLNMRAQLNCLRAYARPAELAPRDLVHLARALARHPPPRLRARPDARGAELIDRRHRAARGRPPPGAPRAGTVGA